MNSFAYLTLQNKELRRTLQFWSMHTAGGKEGKKEKNENNQLILQLCMKKVHKHLC